MPETSSDSLADRANRLYWETERPAGQLARELGISRSKFYALIEPQPTTATCSDCGGDLVFSSRTDRDAGRGRCADCDSVEDVPSPTPGTEAPRGERDQPGTVDRDPTAEPLLPEPRELWVAAACGLVVGLLAGAWFRRRG